MAITTFSQLKPGTACFRFIEGRLETERIVEIAGNGLRLADRIDQAFDWTTNGKDRFVALVYRGLPADPKSITGICVPALSQSVMSMTWPAIGLNMPYVLQNAEWSDPWTHMDA